MISPQITARQQKLHASHSSAIIFIRSWYICIFIKHYSQSSWSQDKSIGHWRFSCIMSFPWRPILSGISDTAIKSSIYFFCFPPYVFRSNFSIHSFSLFICCFCAATGYTEYYFNTESGRVCRQWNYSATAKSIGFWFFMNRWLWVGSYAGMWSIGMFQKWHFLSKYSDQAAGYGRLAERLQCKDLKFEEPWEISVGTALTAKLFHGMFFLMSLVYKRQIEAH